MAPIRATSIHIQTRLRALPRSRMTSRLYLQTFKRCCCIALSSMRPFSLSFLERANNTQEKKFMHMHCSLGMSFQCHTVVSCTWNLHVEVEIGEAENSHKKNICSIIKNPTTFIIFNNYSTEESKNAFNAYYIVFPCAANILLW